MKTKKVLIVDDDPGIRTMNGFTLMHEGFDVFYESEGPSALARLYQEDFDLVLLDLRLPYLSGDHIMKLLKDKDRIPAKVLIISGLPGEVIASTAERYGAAGYLEKPYTPRELLKKVAELFEDFDAPCE
ncbi:response regulator [bacterium]|nr:response regulator [bacterium]MBU3929907.1 response regulator [bacterium]MBU4122889.1 response regulator [bacterium]